MRKKELLNQNISLFEQLEKCRIELKDATNELNAAKNKISKLELENKVLNSRIDYLSKNTLTDTEFTVKTQIVGEKTNAEKIIDNFELSEEMQLGSEVIGKIVVETASAVNKLSDCDDETKHTLSNLIVCRSELAKSEILSICNSESSSETKAEMIGSVLNETLDYYKSVLGQIN